MELILDFKTSETIEEYLTELIHWINSVRLQNKKSYNTLQKLAALHGGGVNFGIIMKQKRMETKTLSLLGRPDILSFEFAIKTQNDITVTNSVYPNWLQLFLTHLTREHKGSDVDSEKWLNEIKISASGLKRWENAKNMNIEKLFRCLKYFGYRMIFTNKININNYV